MEFTIVTYGAGEVLSTTFNAIASLINSNTGTHSIMHLYV